ncbi:hypothetical protein LTR10_015199 [Elasticomyces elasticus]|uniref:Extracellular mutant protein 11 C-terminal domain-containing protein n=1 Tax=Exophiala sideris TaxID=1016849 RepID=A0ABR0JEC8_9EURO|nr:hypothetical protein LTR10_015199 [Elasticomyces elasticus]KAK5032673.1 hypothetical protein LTS07_004083 [Exophiala sideris]KAK5037146.1 hypothetical protein LTR13_004951 [Exophiala sideris]KAK5062198.1 hypothetical protein LTR69_004556 [Exophiala sideris]KAK5182304.1 hypothetical protein LTR44_005315 [Eurotiomycetes sp. CCFEE 6388]
MLYPKNILHNSKAKLTSLLKVARTTKAYVREKLGKLPPNGPRFTINTEQSESYADTASPIGSRVRPPTPYPGGPVSSVPIGNYTSSSSIADISTDNSAMDTPSARPRSRHIVIGNGNASAPGNPQHVEVPDPPPEAMISQHVAHPGSSSAPAPTRRIIIIGPSRTGTTATVLPAIPLHPATPNLASSPRSMRLARRNANRMWRMRVGHMRYNVSFPADYAFRPAPEYYRHRAHSGVQSSPRIFPRHQPQPSVPVEGEQQFLTTHQRPVYRDMGTQTSPQVEDHSTQTSPKVQDQAIQSSPRAPSSRHLSAGGSGEETPCGSPVWGAPLPRRRAREFIKGFGRLEDPFVNAPAQPVFRPVVQQASPPEPAPVQEAAPAHPPPKALSSGSDNRRWSDFDSDEMPSIDNKRLVRVNSNEWQMQHGKETTTTSAQGIADSQAAAAAPAHCMDTSSRAWSSGSSEELASAEDEPLQQEDVPTSEQLPEGQDLNADTPAAAPGYDPLAPYGPIYITPGQILLTGEYRGERDSQPQNRVDPFDYYFGGDPRLDAVYTAAEQYDHLYRENRALQHNNNVSTWKVTVLERELIRHIHKAQEQEAELQVLRSRLEQVERGSVDEGTVVHNEVESTVEDEEISDLYGP